MDVTNVIVNYFESGEYKRISVDARRPTYFERLVVSTVFETTPPPNYPKVSIDSVRSVARAVFHTAKRITSSIRKPITIPVPVIDLRHFEPNNMAHLLFDVIPYCLYAKSVAGPEIKFLLRKVDKPFSDLLDIFGIRPLREDRRVTGDILKIGATRGLSTYDATRTFDCFGINFIPEVYSDMKFASSTRFAKIFLARRPPRALLNQSEITKITAKHGYETVFMEDYSISDQLSIGAQAKHVIAVHGAAMSFLIMNRSIDSLVELLPAHFYMEYYPVCLSPRVGRYEQIIPDFDQRVSLSGWDTKLHFQNLPFSIDEGLLDRILSEFD